jgi:AbrB family looped-hinge helix DNA binding protein
MKAVKVSKKFQILIPAELRKAAKIKPGDKMVALVKHGILRYVPVRPFSETKGMVQGVDIADLRDETDRIP